MKDIFFQQSCRFLGCNFTKKKTPLQVFSRIFPILDEHHSVRIFYIAYLVKNKKDLTYCLFRSLTFLKTSNTFPVLGETSFKWITLRSSSYHILINLSKSSISTAWARRVAVNEDEVWCVSSVQSARALKNSVFCPIDRSISKYIRWKPLLRVRNSPPSAKNF